MEKGCDCFSCSQFRNWDRIDFLKIKGKSQMELWASNLRSVMTWICRAFSDMFISDTSICSIDRLPDEMLIRIVQYIQPNNINNFLTLIALEMVSKRFRHCMVKAHTKIWGNMTELVLGFHPDLPDTQYLCHIGHFTLIPFLQRVPNITKVIVNCGENWICSDILAYFSNHYFSEKLKFIELNVVLPNSETNGLIGTILVDFLLQSATESLESCKLDVTGDGHEQFHTNSISGFLSKCSQLNCVRISFNDWTGFYSSISNLATSIHLLKTVQSIEISGVPQIFLDDVFECFELQADHANSNLAPSQIRALRFTNPDVKSPYVEWMSFETLRSFLSNNNYHSIREFELHFCAHSNNLARMPIVLDHGHLDHFIITFHPHFQFHKVAKIAELIENAQVKNKEIKISIAFFHSDDDEEAKLAIIHHLLIRFDVPIVAEHEGNMWEFIRRKVTVNLKLEKIQDESLICRHPQLQ